MIADAEGVKRMPLSDDEILNLWKGKTKEFEGSYQGARSLHQAIIDRFRQDLSLKRIYDVLGQDPDYIANLRPATRINRKDYKEIHGVGMLW